MASDPNQTPNDPRLRAAIDELAAATRAQAAALESEKSANRAIERFENALEELERRFDKIGSKTDDLETRRSLVDKDINRLQELIENLKAEPATPENQADIRIYEAALARREADRTKLDKTIDDLVRQLEKLDIQIAKTEEKLAGSKEQKDRAVRDVSRTTAQRTEAARRVEEEQIRVEHKESYDRSLMGRLDQFGRILAAGQGNRAVAQGIGAVTRTVSTFTSPVAAAGGLGGMLGQFVGAFNPSTMLVFNQALRDLSAVIGMALKPVMEGLTKVVRAVADALLPIMEELAPVFEEITDALVTILKPVIDVVATAMMALVPIIKVLASVFASLTPLIRASQVLLAGFIELIRTSVSEFLQALGIGDKVKSFTDTLRDAFQTVAKAVILAAAAFAKFIGADAFLKGMIKGLQNTLSGPKSSVGVSTPQNSQIMDALSYGKSVSQASFIATGSDTKKRSQEEWLEEVVNKLKDLESGAADYKTILNDIKRMIEDKSKAFIDAFVRALQEKAGQATWDGAAQALWAARWLSPAAGVAGYYMGGKK